jgi:transcriptional regulator with XRE-family HTH domain
LYIYPICTWAANNFYWVGMSVHLQLRQARKAAGLKQAELASALGITQAAISLIESGGRDTTLTMACHWAAICKVRLCVEDGTPNDEQKHPLMAKIQALIDTNYPPDIELITAMVDHLLTRPR